MSAKWLDKKYELVSGFQVFTSKGFKQTELGEENTTTSEYLQVYFSILS